MPATSFCVRVRFGFLSDLEGVLVAVSASAVVTPATVRGRIGRGRERRRRGRRHEERRVVPICERGFIYF